MVVFLDLLACLWKVMCSNLAFRIMLFFRIKFIFLLWFKKFRCKIFWYVVLFFCLNGPIYSCFLRDSPSLVEKRNIFFQFSNG